VPLLGLMLPLPDGLTEVDRVYRIFSKLAITFLSESIVIVIVGPVSEAFPDHEVNR